MIKKRLFSLCVLSTVIPILPVQAEFRKFTGNGGDSRWENPENWDKGVVPGLDEKVRPGAASVTTTLTTNVTITALQWGVDKTSTLVIDGGTLVTTGDNDYNSASINAPGHLVIQNGGSALFSSYFNLGMKSTEGGTVTISNGSLRVFRDYFHNREYTGTEPLNTRTTILTGGLLDAGSMSLTSGVLDIAGGTVVIRRHLLTKIDEWVQSGRIVAMGGDENWKIEATIDAETGCTVVIAVPTDPSKPKPKPLPIPDRLPPPSPKQVPVEPVVVPYIVG